MPDITKLITAAELARRLNSMVTPQRLEELAAGGIIPHYRLAGRVLFSFQEAKTWLGKHELLRCNGIRPPIGVTPLIMQLSAPPPACPMALRALRPYLVPLPLQSVAYANWPGVYLLTRGEEVVYVGQSCDVARRVGQHVGAKLFDFAWCIRLLPEDLNYVEHRLIDILRPMYNQHNGRWILPPQGSASDDAIVLVNTLAAANPVDQEPDA